MSLYVLDTDTITLHQRGHPAVEKNIVAHHLHDDVAVSIISVEEQWRNGRLTQVRGCTDDDRLPDANRQLTDTVYYRRLFRLLSFSKPAIQRFRTLKSMKHGVRAMDLRIAAITLELQGIVVTRNRRDFQRVPGLTTADWST